MSVEYLTKPMSYILDVQDTKVTSSKVICTVGGKSRSVDQLVGLLEAGMNVARFDFAFGGAAYHSLTLAALREAMQRTGRFCGVMMDTRGPGLMINRASDPAMCLEEEVEPMELQAGHELVITTDMSQKCCSNRLALDAPHLLHHAEPGDVIQIGQHTLAGTGVSVTVQEVRGDEVVCVVDTAGTLSGTLLTVSVQGKRLGSSAVNEWDEKDIAQWGVPSGVDIVSVSYCTCAEDIHRVRRCLLRSDPSSAVHVTAKLESRESLLRFDEILQAADGIILSRAVLGLWLPAEKMFLIQKWIINRCGTAGKPCLVTRVCDTMVDTPRPTRAEATDVANVVLDGADGVLLGAETLRGMFPIQALQTVKAICSAAEQVYNHDTHYSTITRRSDSYLQVESEEMKRADALAVEAVQAARKCDACLLICFTQTGVTPRLLAKYRPKIPILAVIVPRIRPDATHLRWHIDGQTQSRTALLNFGVFPILAQDTQGAGTERQMRQAFAAAKAMGFAKAGRNAVVCDRCRKLVQVVEVW